MNPEQQSPESIREAQLIKAKQALIDRLTWSEELPEEFIAGENQGGVQPIQISNKLVSRCL